MSGKRTAEDSSESATFKRAKSGTACIQCRSKKTRCEILPTPGDESDNRCYRCKVMKMSCSLSAQAESSESPSSPAKESPRQMSPPSTRAKTIRHILGNSGHFQHPLATSIHQISSSIVTSFPYPRVEILTPTQTERLLQIFQERYAAWLHLPLTMHHPPRSEFLTLVKCLLASRHVDPLSLSSVTPQLSRIVEDRLASEMLSLSPTREIIHGLLVLAQWSPIAVGDRPARDRRLVAANAANLAYTLGLHRASAIVSGYTKSPPKDVEQEMEFKAAQDDTRLWLSLCAVESTLCIGSERVPISRRSKSDMSWLRLSEISSNSANTSDIRLGVLTHLFEMTANGMIAEPEPPAWKDISKLMTSMDHLSASMFPLFILAEQETAQLYMLQLDYYFCRLQVLLHAITCCIGVDTDISGHKWWTKHGGDVERGIVTWGITSVTDAQKLVVAALSHVDFLVDAPDSTFAIIYYAASVLLKSAQEVHRQFGTKLWPGTTDALVKRVATTFANIALSREHGPAKYARLLEAHLAEYPLPGGSATMVSAASPLHEGQASSSSASTYNGFMGPDDMGGFNLDSLEYPQLDQYWAHFIQGLSSGTFTIES